MQRYLQPDFLKEKGFQAFDSWAADFVNIETVIELDPTGTSFRPKKRCSSFNNVPELMTQFRRCTDIQTAEMLKLPIPKLKDGRYTVCVIEPSEEQKQYIAECGERAEEIKFANVDPRLDNYLKITHDGKMCAIDMRLVDPNAEDRPDSKINIAIENIAAKYEEFNDEKLTQLVFLDVSTPSSEFNLYDDIRNKLCNNYGIPKAEIAFVHEAKNDREKLKMFEKVNSGAIRIIIGSTSKLGAGTNIQNKLCALHHIDVAWKPSDIEQREGRILRRGNINEEVEIFRYVTKGSFDAYSWQIIENKQKMISQIMTDKISGRSVDDVDEQSLNYAEIKMLATGDTRIKEQLELKTSVQRLQLQRRQFKETQAQARKQLDVDIPNQIKTTSELLEKYKAVYEYAKHFPKAASDDDFRMVVKGEEYNNKKDAGTALLSAVNVVGLNSLKVGIYRGFDIYATMDALCETHMILKAKNVSLDGYLGTSITGNITRMDNIIDEALPERIINYTKTIENAHAQFDEFTKLISQTFPKEDEYQEKNRRYKELTRELALDEHSSNGIELYVDECEEQGKGR